MVMYRGSLHMSGHHLANNRHVCIAQEPKHVKDVDCMLAASRHVSLLM